MPEKHSCDGHTFSTIGVSPIEGGGHTALNALLPQIERVHTGGTLQQGGPQERKNKTSVPIHSFLRVAHMFNHGWWRLAVGG